MLDVNIVYSKPRVSSKLSLSKAQISSRAADVFAARGSRQSSSRCHLKYHFTARQLFSGVPLLSGVGQVVGDGCLSDAPFSIESGLCLPTRGPKNRDAQKFVLIRAKHKRKEIKKKGNSPDDFGGTDRCK